MGARRAAGIGVAFEGTPLKGAKLVGMPLRPELARMDRAEQRGRARAQLALAEDSRVLLVSGGSLGALRLNQAVVSQAQMLLAGGNQILHLTGPGKAEPIRQAIAQLEGHERYRVLEYLPQMELALAAADLAVQRAGAATVSELACAGLPSVLVPLPIGNGEQRLNASMLLRAGGAILVEDSAFPNWAKANLADLLNDQQRQAKMASAAASVAIRDGAERLVDLIEEAAR
jgi:UDP-N-acetylglucosamine--N-acetylmuramyl-(pentapeptide) pyrophosphoryl-undecaprenol N-acetylglucosamine transferase